MLLDYLFGFQREMPNFRQRTKGYHPGLGGPIQSTNYWAIRKSAPVGALIVVATAVHHCHLDRNGGTGLGQCADWPKLFESRARIGMTKNLRVARGIGDIIEIGHTKYSVNC